jgi:hypothetical protein
MKLGLLPEQLRLYLISSFCQICLTKIYSLQTAAELEEITMNKIAVSLYLCELTLLLVAAVSISCHYQITKTMNSTD